MIIETPHWIAHKNEKGKLSTIYSLCTHPSGTRIATAGQDQKVKVWRVSGILSEKAGEDDSQTLLSTLSDHSGAVLCVRFSNIDGLYLASGSDDTKISFLGRNTSGGKVFGEEIENVEVWKRQETLSGHASDVSDLAWSPDNDFLASAGFDSFSDDKTVKIVRVSDWKLESEISSPFQTAASTTFFRRLTWSPEGSCIVTSNGENGGFPTAPIIQRDGFVSEVSLVGHKAPVEVALFNPSLFRLPLTLKEKSKEPLSAICAVGSQDTEHGLQAKDKILVETPLQLNLEKKIELNEHKERKDRFLNLMNEANVTAGDKSEDFISSSSTKPVETISDDMIIDTAEKIQNEQHILQKPTIISSAFVSKNQTVGEKGGKKRITPVFVRNLTEDNNSVPATVTLSCTNKRKTMNDNQENLNPTNYILPTVLTSTVPSSILEIPDVQGKLRVVISMSSLNGNKSINFECINISKSSSKVYVTHGTNLMWEDKLNQSIISLGGSEKFLCIACLNGLIFTYTPAGRRLYSPFSLESPASYLESCDEFLMVITALGNVYVWNIEKEICLIKKESIGHFLSPTQNSENSTKNKTKRVNVKSTVEISKVKLVRELPFIHLNDGKIYTFNLKLQCWVLVSDGSSTYSTAESALSMLRKNWSVESSERYLKRLEISEIENQLCHLKVEKKAKEYKEILLFYGRKLSNENCIEKITELLESLLGPISNINETTTDDWDPYILGISKRNLLKDLIDVFGSNRNLQKLLFLYNESILELERKEQKLTDNRVYLDN
ncbi:HIR complex subunit [Clydaea vesicula]|uniref:Protein HIR n=1 Tax=Clydaea vesicula TaxID=447962 RepID=A0AAD5U502_9FUNG|nr:HIR complex subunit [Clydaea vesicula]